VEATVVRAKAGDTLAKLARVHGVTFAALLKLNPEAARVLHPGDEVRLPGASAPAKGQSTPTSHRTRKGETLAVIARKYGLEPADLKAWNRLQGDRVRVGQILRLHPR
jgi:LysM repeat protein